MARAKKQGTAIGRPEALRRNGMADKLSELRPLVQNGTMIQREAARTLGVGRATIARMVAARKGIKNGALGALENSVIRLVAKGAP